FSLLYEPAPGEGTTLQFDPSQCSITVWKTRLLRTTAPTAQALFAERATIPNRPPVTLALEVPFHCVPSQCSMSVFVFFLNPTAQTLFAETAATPLNSVLPLPMFALLTTLHCVPSQCSVSVRFLPPLM